MSGQAADDKDQGARQGRDLAARLFLPADLRSGAPIGVALSGGGDSVALLHLLRGQGFHFYAATVDHALRPESRAEAEAVARDCQRLDIPHHILTWAHGGRPAGNMMESAREARMQLLSDWAGAQGLAAVALGHTADDQAETLLIELSRAAGIDGLGGMRADWQQAGMRWLRPMLDLGRDELRDWLRGCGIGWIDDPSNDSPRFLRVRMRKALAALKPLGLTAAHLAASSAHLAEARASLNAHAAEAASRICQPQAGAIRIDSAGFAALPGETARRITRAMLLWLTGAAHAPRGPQIARLASAIASGASATLTGCRLKSSWLAREPRSLGSGFNHPLWQIEPPPDLHLSALGAKGCLQLPDWRSPGLPRHVLEASPAFWRDERLIAAPLAHFGPEITVKSDAAFIPFLLSH